MRDGPYFVDSRQCAEKLAQAHMVTSAGECNRSGRCEVKVPGPRTWQGNYLMLPCGTLRLGAVSGIATAGNTADFHYERELVVNPRVAEATMFCNFEAPVAGVVGKDRRARRDDAGRWSLVE